jgi:hypothetical protein
MTLTQELFMISSKRLLAGATLLAGITFGVAGCAQDHSKDIPADAMMMSEGTGSVSARPSHDGTVYVYDASADRIVYQGKVEKGQLVRLDTETRKLTLDGDTLTEKGIDGGHRHKIYFDRSNEDDGDRTHRRVETIERRRDN